MPEDGREFKLVHIYYGDAYAIYVFFGNLPLNKVLSAYTEESESLFFYYSFNWISDQLQSYFC